MSASPGLSRRALLGGGLARIRERFDAAAPLEPRARAAARPPWAADDWDVFTAACSGGIAPLLDALGAGPGDRMLEVAAGGGVLAHAAADRGAELVVADVRSHALPFPDAGFDRVAAAFGVVHAPDMRAAGRELERVLRPGGRLALLTWASAGSMGALLRIARRLRDVGHARARAERWGSYEGLQLALEGFPRFEVGELDLRLRFVDEDALWNALTTAPGPLAVHGAESVRAEVEARLEPFLRAAGDALELRVDACLVTADASG